MILTTAAAYCLALNVYFEARDQDKDGQRMIAEVTMERVHRTGFPKTVCGVVWDKGAFSWTDDGKPDKPTDTKAWLQAQMIANEVLLNGCELCTGATYYHNIAVDPYWDKGYNYIGKWGNHLFYAKKGCDE